ncbi:hypothetical protein [Carboxylicivirga caseinilyticus]|uniref:hypothetical protein n=1 Tax=Carboxylicivirga caseinilyticus TaxID=3417572 RepID=UPI003D34520B|nr:hypothetical protein [Marinilabiliaceae bacterium A049]
MKNRFFFGITLVGLSSIILSSCSSVPQAEIDTTKEAIEQAKAAGAEVYVHENFIALQDSMDHVMINVESEKTKLFKNYTAVKEQLANVALYAVEVKNLSEVRKEELNVEIQKTITEVKGLIESNRNLILEAPKGKEGTTALIAIKGEIDAIEISLNDATTQLASGDYIATLDKTKAIKEKASAINTELSEVIAKYNKGKKS